jgi:hypothetical protein
MSSPASRGNSQIWHLSEMDALESAYDIETLSIAILVRASAFEAVFLWFEIQGQIDGLDLWVIRRKWNRIMANSSYTVKQISIKPADFQKKTN